MTRKKISIGLLLMYRDVHTHKLTALLSECAGFEKLKPQSHKGVYQLTVRGSAERGETIIEALLRETAYQLGPVMQRLVRRHLKQLHEIHESSTPHEQVHFFSLLLPRSPERLMKVNLKPLDESTILRIQGIKQGARLSVASNHDMTMFAEDKIATEKAFRFLEEL